MFVCGATLFKLILPVVLSYNVLHFRLTDKARSSPAVEDGNPDGTGARMDAGAGAGAGSGGDSSPGKLARGSSGTTFRAEGNPSELWEPTDAALGSSPDSASSPARLRSSSSPSSSFASAISPRAWAAVPRPP